MFREQTQKFQEALDKHEDLIFKEKEQLKSHLDYMEEASKLAAGSNQNSVVVNAQQYTKRKDLIAPCKNRIASHLKNMGNIRASMLELADKIVVEPRDFYSALKPKMEKWALLKSREQEQVSSQWYLAHQSNLPCEAPTTDLLDEVFFEVDPE